MRDRETSSSVYSFLGSNLPAVGLTVRPTDVKTPYGHVVQAINHRGDSMLLIPAEPAGLDFQSWKNDSISFGYDTLGSAGDQRLYLVLTCMAQRFVGEFSLMADDVLDSIANNPAEAERVTRQVLHRWREMFREQRRPLMSDEKVVGLLAELLFLEELTEVHGPRVLRQWVGPTGGRHDFTFPNADVEIKASTSRESFSVTVHGSQQLQQGPDIALFIRGYKFERHPGGDCLPEVLQRLWDCGLDRLELLRAVSELGYSEADSTQYLPKRFSLLDKRTCRVGGIFPRLTEETVEPVIFRKLSNVSYVVDLGPEPEELLDLGSLECEA